jgi:predicted AAA+ superfamily ATPase
MEGFVSQAGRRQLVIDEVQRVPELTLAVKAAIDADRSPGRFILTGSSSLLRVRGTADSLAGRVARVDLYGLSEGERVGTIDDFATSARIHAAILPEFRTEIDRSDYIASIARGGFPELTQLPDSMRGRWLDDYARSITGRDLTELRREVSPARAIAVLRTLAGRQSTELVKAKLADQTSVPPRTITGYLDLLHDVGLVTSIPPWTPNLSKREIGRPKTLVIDSALALRLSRMTPEQLNRLEYGEALGAFLEGLVTAELMKQRTWTTAPFELFHYRDRTGTEVDLVLEFDDGRVIGIEVKSSSSYSGRQFGGLRKLRDQLGDRFIAGIVLGTGSGGYRFSDRLYGAPISALWQFTQR